MAAPRDATLLCLLICCSAAAQRLVESDNEDHRPTMLRLLNASALATLEQQATLDAAAGLSNVSLSDLQKDNGTLHLQQRYRARKKQERLLLIQAQILQRLRVTPWRHNNHSASAAFSQEDRSRMQQIFERMHQLHQMRHGSNDLHPGQQNQDRNQNVYAERFQSYYPACAPPNHTDRTMWELPGSLRLFYPVSFPSRGANAPTETTVLSAKLRLHKRSTNSQIEETNCVDCIPPPPSSYPTFLLPSASTLTVSVYHFVKPLKQHRREKKRLVDSRVITVDQEGWLEFNVAPSLHQWFHNRHRNYGLDVEVEDAAGNKLDPNKFFRNVNCSDPAAVQESPFPNLLDIHPDMAENESSLFDNETYPTLDLQTAEFSRHPLMGQHELLEQSREGAQQLAGSDQQRLVRKRHTGYVQLAQHWNQLCKRETVYVSFQELGLEDVVVEPGLRVSYCASSHHRHDMHKKISDCCVATAYRPLHFHYLAEDGDTHRFNLNDVSARHCSCGIS